MNFDVNYLSNQAAFRVRPKSRDKNLNIFRKERAFKMKYKAVCIILKGLLIKKITQVFLKGETPTLTFWFFA